MKRQNILLISLFVFLLLIRIISFSADPPEWLTDDLGLFADEGFKTYSARNQVLFGSPAVDERDSYPGWVKQSPVSHNMFVALFTLFGTGYVQARLLNILLSILSLGLFYYIIRWFYDNKTAILGTLFFGVNFVYLVYNKIALLETGMTFFLLLSVAFWLHSKQYKWLISLSALSFVLAYLYKSIAIFFLPVLIYMFIDVFDLKLSTLKKTKVWVSLSAGLVAIIAFFFLIIPDYSKKIIILIMNRSPDSISSAFILFRQLWYQYFFQYNIVLLFTLVLYLIVASIRVVRKEKIERLEVLFLVWTVSIIGLLALQPYRPLRYFIPLIPSLCFFMVLAIQRHQIISEFFKKFNRPANRATLQGVMFLIFFAMTFIVFKFIMYMTNDAFRQHVAIYSIFAFIISIIGSYFLMNYFIAPKKNRKLFMNAMIVIYLLSSLIPIGIWAFHPTHDLVDSSKDLASILEEKDIVLGINWVQALCLETSNVCYLASGTANEANDVFKEYNITYFISDDYNNPDYNVEFLKNPNFEKSLTNIKNYTLGQFNVSLYKFNQTTFYQEE